MDKRVLVIVITLVSLLLPGRPPAAAQSKADCLACHSDTSLTMEKGGTQRSIYVNEALLNASAHRKLVCVACHPGFNPENVPHKEKIEEVNCLTCHKDVQFKHTFHPQLAKAIAAHEPPDVGCKDCHGTHEIVSPKVPGSKFSDQKVEESCGECHGDVRETFDKSAHGRALAAAVAGAPNCLTCHRHEVTLGGMTGDTLSHKVAQEKLCLSCHLDNPEVRARTSPTAGFIAAYEKSVHGAALLKGNPRAANCIDCHGSHEMQKGVESASLVSKKNIPSTCGKCHEEITKEFRQSIHGVAAANGVKDAPVCTDCHGEHNILPPSDPRSSVAAANVSARVCSPCHSSVKLSEKYGIASNRFQTFEDSYHGLAIRAGDVEVANCASCHGAHNIKPSSDSTSTISKANLARTCGKCHPGANAKFAIGAVHVAFTDRAEPALYWVSTIYLILIAVVVGGMFLHNLLDFLRKARRKLMIRRGRIVPEHVGHRLYLRMSTNERFQHGTLMLSFLTLVFTGFALKFPDAWWVVPIRNLSPMMFEIRGIVHRVAGVLLILAGLYHLYYVLFVPRGRELLRDLIPVPQDIKDAVAVLRYNLGLTSIKPLFARFSYIEKSEYWALVWGTIIMGATGAILWFDNTFIGLLTKLWWDVARGVHYYEAWLATLSIIVWHLYFVIFNPDAYPMNLAWLKGTLTEEEMAEEHPLELAKLEEREIAEALAEKSGVEEDAKPEAVSR